MIKTATPIAPGEGVMGIPACGSVIGRVNARIVVEIIWW
jgi:hypothetical protein